MVYASFDIPAGDDQNKIRELLENSAIFLGCEVEVFPEAWGTYRLITLYVWSDNTTNKFKNDDELEESIRTLSGVE